MREEPITLPVRTHEEKVRFPIDYRIPGESISFNNGSFWEMRIISEPKISTGNNANISRTFPFSLRCLSQRPFEWRIQTFFR